MRECNSRLWSAEEMLLDLLEQIRDGAIKPKQIAVHWFEDIPESNNIGPHQFVLSNCTIPDHNLLLDIGKAKMMNLIADSDV